MKTNLQIQKESNHERYFFDISVFRCEEKVCQEEYNNKVAKLESFYREFNQDINPTFNYRSLAESSLQEKRSSFLYGELVGMIRLFAIHGQIRAELYFVKERISKNLKNKTWELAETKFFEYWVNSTNSNQEIFEWIIEEIKKQNKEGRLKNRYIDLGCLEYSGKYLDYKELTNFS